MEENAKKTKPTVSNVVEKNESLVPSNIKRKEFGSGVEHKPKVEKYQTTNKIKDEDLAQDKTDNKDLKDGLFTKLFGEKPEKETSYSTSVDTYEQKQGKFITGFNRAVNSFTDTIHSSYSYLYSDVLAKVQEIGTALVVGKYKGYPLIWLRKGKGGDKDSDSSHFHHRRKRAGRNKKEKGKGKSSRRGRTRGRFGSKIRGGGKVALLGLLAYGGYELFSHSRESEASDLPDDEVISQVDTQQEQETEDGETPSNVEIEPEESEQESESSTDEDTPSNTKTQPQENQESEISSNVNIPTKEEIDEDTSIPTESEIDDKNIEPQVSRPIQEDSQSPSSSGEVPASDKNNNQETPIVVPSSAPKPNIKTKKKTSPIAAKDTEKPASEVSNITTSSTVTTTSSVNKESRPTAVSQPNVVIIPKIPVPRLEEQPKAPETSLPKKPESSSPLASDRKINKPLSSSTSQEKPKNTDNVIEKERKEVASTVNTQSKDLDDNIKEKNKSRAKSISEKLEKGFSTIETTLGNWWTSFTSGVSNFFGNMGGGQQGNNPNYPTSNVPLPPPRSTAKYKITGEGINQAAIGKNTSPRNLMVYNYGNVKVLDSSHYAAYASHLDGLMGIGERLMHYASSKNFGYANTIRKIMYIYAPPSDGNNTASYVANLSKKAGIGPDQPIDFRNPAMFAPIIQFIPLFEHSKKISLSDAQAAASALVSGRNPNIIGTAPDRSGKYYTFNNQSAPAQDQTQPLTPMQQPLQMTPPVQPQQQQTPTMVASNQQPLFSGSPPQIPYQPQQAPATGNAQSAPFMPPVMPVSQSNVQPNQSQGQPQQVQPQQSTQPVAQNYHPSAPTQPISEENFASRLQVNPNNPQVQASLNNLDKQVSNAAPDIAKASEQEVNSLPSIPSPVGSPIGETDNQAQVNTNSASPVPSNSDTQPVQDTTPQDATTFIAQAQEDVMNLTQNIKDVMKSPVFSEDSVSDTLLPITNRVNHFLDNISDFSSTLNQLPNQMPVPPIIINMQTNSKPLIGFNPEIVDLSIERAKMARDSSIIRLKSVIPRIIT